MTNDEIIDLIKQTKALKERIDRAVEMWAGKIDESNRLYAEGQAETAEAAKLRRAAPKMAEGWVADRRHVFLGYGYAAQVWPDASERCWRCSVCGDRHLSGRVARAAADAVLRADGWVLLDEEAPRG